MILIGVFCVAQKEKPKVAIDDPHRESNQMDVYISVGFALAAGFFISMNSLIMRHYVKYVHFTSMQLTIDGLFLNGIIVALFSMALLRIDYNIAFITEGVL